MPMPTLPFHLPNVPFGLDGWLRKLYREGRHFQALSAELHRASLLSPSQLQELQNHLLRRMIAHCHAHVPYYRELFQSLHIRPQDIRDRHDLSALPLLDKNTVVTHFEQFLSRKHLNRLCKVATTSGTTGSPARFVRDYHSINVEHACAWRQWRATGDNGKRRVTLRGQVVVPMAQQHPPFWRYNRSNQELLLCGFHLTPDNAHHYIEQILRFRPAILSAYPSNAWRLAQFFQDAGIHYRFDAVYTSSETLETEHQLDIQRIFQAPLYDWYGQAERVAAIGHCPHQRYHVQEDYAVTEFLPLVGGGAEIVGTSLHNRVMPLLRYRTGDQVILPTSESTPCPCGSAFRQVQRVLGRPCHYLITPEGYRIALANHLLHGVAHVLEAQYVQAQPGELLIRVVTQAGFDQTQRQQLIARAQRYTSPHMRVRIEEVDDIPRGPNGKFIPLVSTLL